MNHSQIVTLLSNMVSRYLEVGSDYANAAQGMPKFKRVANRLGFKFLGAGFFSIALAHKDHAEIAFKVGLKKEDSGAAYAAYCRANQGKAGIPVVHDIQRHDDCYTVVMDRYVSMEGELGHNVRRALFAGVQMVIEHGQEVGAAVYEAELSRFTATLEDCEQLESYAYNLFTTATEIRAFFKGIAEFDCHDGNVMANGSNQIFITDPISFTRGIKGWDIIETGLDGIEADRIAAHAEKCKARHEYRKGRASRRKRRAKNKRIREARWARADREGRVERAQRKIDNAAWHHLRFREQEAMGGSYLINKARKLRDADHVALICGRELLVDKMLDAMLMG